MQIGGQAVGVQKRVRPGKRAISEPRASVRAPPCGGRTRVSCGPLGGAAVAAGLLRFFILTAREKPL